ncbi:MAG: hypothetical protein U9Q07_04055 [Planctomycetota bacterium]|nr:hypothetical protein [Planctomycetota bacterium]
MVTWQEAEDTEPTTPGFYEYRWLYGTPKMKHKWTRVEIIREGSELFVIDGRVETPSRLNTYTGATWRKVKGR